jgi:hypothetical protein
MLLSLHTGLLALVTAWQQQQQQQPGTTQQQQQDILHVPAVLLCAVLRVLTVLVSITPYERLPSTLLPSVVDSVHLLWQQLVPAQQQGVPRAAAATAPTAAAVSGSSAASVPLLALPGGSTAGSAAAAAAGMAWGSSATVVAAVAVLAQAFSSRKPLPALNTWLKGTCTPMAASSSSSAAAGAGAAAATAGKERLTGSSKSSSSSRGVSLTTCLLTAAASPDCLLRVEALAALRGCCINYPDALPLQQQQHCLSQLQPAAGFSNGHEEYSSDITNSSTTTSSSSSDGACWQQLLDVVDISVAAAAAEKPTSARSTPRSSPRASNTAVGDDDKPSAAAAAAAADGSGSTSPEVKAGQHAVRLLGDWLAAAAAAAVSAADQAHQLQLIDQQWAVLQALAVQWSTVLQLLLSQAVWHHPSPVIRAAAAAVCGGIPANVWPLLPPALRQQLLAAVAATAAGSDVTAVRAAACKLLGSCAALPGALAQQQQQHEPVVAQVEQQRQQAADVPQQQQQQQLLQALAQCVCDGAVSVRLSAAWALANVCDGLKSQVQVQAVLPVQHNSTAVPSTTSSTLQGPQQQQEEQQWGAVVGDVLGPGMLHVLCDAAVAAARDTEKVRAHGVRAVGALLAAWQPSWGLDSSSSSSSSSGVGVQSAGTGAPGEPAAAGPAAPEGTGTAGSDAQWSWVQAWFKASFGVLQSCLAARSMKVVWNAACAAAAGLQSDAVMLHPVAADSTPGLLRMLVLLVRDSGNYKIKTHAAAALAAPQHRTAYGEVFADALMVVLSGLQTLQGSSSSTQQVPAAGMQGDMQQSTAAAAAAVEGGDSLEDEGAFPNYRYALWVWLLVHKECFFISRRAGLPTQLCCERLPRLYKLEHCEVVWWGCVVVQTHLVVSCELPSCNLCFLSCF